MKTQTLYHGVAGGSRGAHGRMETQDRLGRWGAGQGGPPRRRGEDSTPHPGPWLTGTLSGWVLSLVLGASLGLVSS